ncbi:MAG: response regulator [Chloroflexi bacterium]|nr:MAG: response regulator [Chloroflexota bacterium]
MEFAPRAARASVLLVDDDTSKLTALESVLAPLGQNLVRAESGREALRAVLADDFAVILLDVRMSGMDGFETAELIRQRERSERTPIIFVTAYGAGEANLERGYRLGAVDFIFAPVVPEILRTKVSVFVDLMLKTDEIRLQAERLRELERRELSRRLERAELGRLQAEARFASVLDFAADGIVALDGQRHVVLFNRGAEHIFGRTAAETIGQPIDVLLPDGVEEFLLPRDGDGEGVGRHDRHRQEVAAVRAGGHPPGHLRAQGRRGRGAQAQRGSQPEAERGGRPRRPSRRLARPLRGARPAARPGQRRGQGRRGGPAPGRRPGRAQRRRPARRRGRRQRPARGAAPPPAADPARHLRAHAGGRRRPRPRAAGRGRAGADERRAPHRGAAPRGRRPGERGAGAHPAPRRPLHRRRHRDAAPHRQRGHRRPAQRPALR